MLRMNVPVEMPVTGSSLTYGEMFRWRCAGRYRWRRRTGNKASPPRPGIALPMPQTFGYIAATCA